MNVLAKTSQNHFLFLEDHTQFMIFKSEGKWHQDEFITVKFIHLHREIKVFSFWNMKNTCFGVNAKFLI